MTTVATGIATGVLSVLFVTLGVVLLVVAQGPGIGSARGLRRDHGRHTRPRSTDLLDRIVARSILLTVLAAFASIYLDGGISWIGATMIGAMVTKLSIAELHRRGGRRRAQPPRSECRLRAVGGDGPWRKRRQAPRPRPRFPGPPWIPTCSSASTRTRFCNLMLSPKVCGRSPILRCPPWPGWSRPTTSAGIFSPG